ncbi:MAG: MgtC/SapB family protein [Cyclobacteriaceae bacterium]|nr:MgtC/SapB family protein [Cyclobacteriaceae bacterium]
MEEPLFQNVSDQLFILLDVFIAIILGGVVGYEREQKDKPAGLRTNMIIAGATALLFSLGRVLVSSFEDTVQTDALGIDSTRIIHAIIVGVSFIGAGTILKGKGKEKVYYLTTSATILLSAGIGISVAMRNYILAVGITIFVIIINSAMQKLSIRNSGHKEKTSDQQTK